MTRSKTTKNVFDKRKGKSVELLPSPLKDAIGNATIKGCWIVYGAEKNGKSWFTLKMVKELARFERVHYISAEEGLDDSFQVAMKRAGITTADNILWDEYMPIFSDDPNVDDKDDPECIVGKFSKQRSANIIVIDNLTMYADEMKPSEIKKRLTKALPNKLIIFVAHEERKEPAPALAKHAKKMAHTIFHIVGLKAIVTSRFGNGGELVIDEEKCEIYHGSN